MMVVVGGIDRNLNDGTEFDNVLFSAETFTIGVDAKVNKSRRKQLR